MKIYPKLIIASLVIACGLEYVLHHNYSKLKSEIKADEEAKQHLQDEAFKEQQKKELVDFTYKVMDIPPVSKLSKAKREMLADKVANITIKYIDKQDAREQYVAMLKIESNFNNNVKSSAGAIGIAQIMKPTFKFAADADDCGIDVDSDDIYNEDINLEIGTCFYALLLKENNNNSRLASVWYNGGPKSVEILKKLGDINKESSNYVLKTEYIKELANR